MFVFLKDFVYLLSERQKGKEKEGEKHQCVVASRVFLAGDLAQNPGMCSGWESNRELSVRRLALSPLSHTSQGR